MKSYPGKPVRIVVPFPPGGGNDILGRLLAPKLAELYSQPFLIDNRPGQDGIIGSTFVSKSAPDGYTLLVISLSFTTNAHIHKTPYDPVKSFTPVAQIGSGTQMLTATMKLPVNNIKELAESEQLAAVDILQDLPGNGIRVVGLPISFDRQRPRSARPAPGLGEHNAEVFDELLSKV